MSGKRLRNFRGLFSLAKEVYEDWKEIGKRNPPTNVGWCHLAGGTATGSE